MQDPLTMLHKNCLPLVDKAIAALLNSGEFPMLQLSQDSGPAQELVLKWQSFLSQLFSISDWQREFFKPSQVQFPGVALLAFSETVPLLRLTEQQKYCSRRAIYEEFNLDAIPIADQLVSFWFHELQYECDVRLRAITQTDEIETLESMLRREGIDKDSPRMAMDETEFQTEVNQLMDSHLVQGQILRIRRLVFKATLQQRTVLLPILCNLVRNKDLAEPIRETAYNAVYELAERPVKDWPVVRKETVGFTFPDDIDWTLLRQISPPPHRMEKS